MQPGWQKYMIASRYIPQIIVNQRLPQIGDEHKLLRSKTDIPGLYIAGDWASPHSILQKELLAVEYRQLKKLSERKRVNMVQISNEDYKQFKPLLFSIGYRMLGSVAEAEDIVQETFLKAYQIDDQKIDNKKAYLCKIMTNRCLDVLKSARYRREHYVGPWNPEPLLLESSPDFDPSEVILQKEGLSIAYLRMMEHLAPDDRAVLLLREVFNFSYLEISNIIEKKEENCRKIFSRAKQKISTHRG